MNSDDSEPVRLSAGCLSLELMPQHGGAVSAFRMANDGRMIDLMRPMILPDGASLPALHSSMFPMAPFANCIRDNTFLFAGEVYRVSPNMAGARLNYHGSGWLLPWRLGATSTNFAELLLEDAVVDESYRFSAVQRFYLEPTGLSVELTLTNRADHAMPFSFGEHPWFPRHGAVMVRFAATGFWYEDSDGHAEHLVPLSGRLDYSQWREPARSYQNRCYAGWSGRAEIVWPEIGVGLQVEADDVFKHLMFHVPHGEQEVFCLEPQTNAPCAFDGLHDEQVTPPGVHILGAGESASGVLHFWPFDPASRR